jgi:hypothetical protein
MILDILFWVFFVLGAVTVFVDTPAPWQRAPWVCAFICLGILGLKVVAFR